jgi:phenylacetate-coenzyme A ligase PaaK-like adenylate-forming protein
MAGGECLAPEAGAAIERAFGCPLTNEYGASECLSMGTVAARVGSTSMRTGFCSSPLTRILPDPAG